MSFLTVLYAGEWQTVLPDKIVLRCCVVVLQQKSHQGQLWHTDAKLEFLIPHRVESCKDEYLCFSKFFEKVFDK